MEAELPRAPQCVAHRSTDRRQRAALAPAFAAARRRVSAVALLLIDLDNFKSINDAFGHATGDAVLREFGVRARDVLRDGDVLIRYGGDEFVVVLPKAHLAQAHQVAERLLAYVSGRPIASSPPLTLTLSIGCADVDLTTPDLPLATLLERADAHLRQAKRRGRNQVVSMAEAPPTAATPVAAADAQGRLIERDSAFAKMLAWLDALTEGERGLLRVVSAPGIGLTRFLGAVERTARLRGYQLLSLAGHPALRLRQYGALAECSACGSGDVDPHDLEHLLAWAQLAPATGLLVIVDRVSEVDAATLELLGQLVAQQGLLRVGLVIGLHPGLAELVRLPDLPVRAEIRLEPFSLVALQVWLRGTLNWDASTEFSAWLYQQTEGYPALLQAAVRHLAAEGLLRRLANKAGWQVSPFVQEYPLRAWLLRDRAREEESSAFTRPYGLLVGRSAELRTLKRALAEQRMVGVTGPGGVGKTHLALQGAAELGAQFADGAVVVPLAEVTAMEFVPSALVGALGLVISGRQEPQAIALEYLAAREMLLVLDSIEHLPAIHVLVRDLLAAAPRVRVLVTTRDAAVVPADVVVTLQGVAAGSDLFVHLSGPAAPPAPPAGESLAAIQHICRLVQGYPLAIKMLASWTSLFSCAEIVERLAQHVEDRTGDALGDNTETRSSPMQTVFGFFWTLLAERDRQCIGGLALFRGGFTAEAALAVTAVTPFLLAALRDRAFVQIDAAGRYYLHELLRQYAWSRLQGDAVPTAEIEQRHAAWYARLAATSAKDMRGPHFRQWVERLEAEIDNVRTALTWELANAPLVALQAALDLTEFWLAGTYPIEGHRWIERALTRAEDFPGTLPPSLRLSALTRLGRLERHWGDTGSARRHLTTALTLAEGEHAGSARELAYLLSTLANIETDVGTHERAVSFAQQALTYARGLDSPRDLAATTSMAVWPLIFAGNFAEATRAAEEGLQASITSGDHRSLANITNAKATIAYYDPGRHDEASALYQQAIDLYEALSDWSGLLLAFNNLANVYVDGHQFDLAAHAYAAARRIGRRVSRHRMMSSVLSGSAIVASVRGDDTAAWGFWREAMQLALASDNSLVLEECAVSLAYVWTRGGFAAHAAVLLGLIGLQPAGKPWLLPVIERARAATQPMLSADRWELLLAHGSGLDLAEVANLLLSRAGPHDVPESILPSPSAEEVPC